MSDEQSAEHLDEHFKRWTIHFRGRVQGVGFRAATARIAEGYDVTGSVQNLMDGGVRLMIEGRTTELRAMLLEVNRVLGRNILSQDCTVSPAQKDETDFRITY